MLAIFLMIFMITSYHVTVFKETKTNHKFRMVSFMAAVISFCVATGIAPGTPGVTLLAIGLIGINIWDSGNPREYFKDIGRHIRIIK